MIDPMTGLDDGQDTGGGYDFDRWQQLAQQYGKTLTPDIMRTLQSVPPSEVESYIKSIVSGPVTIPKGTIPGQTPGQFAEDQKNPGGYVFQPTAGTPPPTTPPPGNGQPSIGGTLSGGGGGFTPPPQVNLGGPNGIPYIPGTPNFHPPSRGIPAPWSYDKFQAPTFEQAQNEPGYQFTAQQGNDALQRWAAARGTLNDSGTAKALIDYGQNAASTNYQNVWNRSFNAWNADVGNSLDAYKTNYGTQFSDPFEADYRSFLDTIVNPAMTAYGTQAQAGQRQNELNYNNAWDQELFGYQKDRDKVNDRFRLATL